MKYFAILKDSFREALDSKVLYVMLVLSTLVILFVALITFKPVSAQTTMELFFPSAELQGLSLMNFALYNHEWREVNESPIDNRKKAVGDDDDVRGRMALLHEYRLEKVTVAEGGEPDSPNSDYVLIVSEVFPLPKPADAEREKAATARVRKIFDRADEFGLIRIGEITVEPPADPKQDPFGQRMRFRVPLHSTPETHRMWAHTTGILVWELPIPPAPLGYQIYVLSRVVILFGSWIAINVGVIVTSFFFPNMLSKGTIDMLLVKPVHRWALVVYKYVGGLTFIFINGAYAIGGMWLVLGLRTGIWPTGCLLLILTMTFFFAILYAISTYVSVVTRSTIASIMLTLLAWVVFFGVGWSHGKINEIRLKENVMAKLNPDAPMDRWGDSRLATTVNVFHAITPRTEGLNQLNDRIVYCDLITGSTANMAKLKISDQEWAGSLIVSGIWIALFLGIACVWFSFKDY